MINQALNQICIKVQKALNAEFDAIGAQTCRIIRANLEKQSNGQIKLDLMTLTDIQIIAKYGKE